MASSDFAVKIAEGVGDTGARLVISSREARAPLVVGAALPRRSHRSAVVTEAS